MYTFYVLLVILKICLVKCHLNVTDQRFKELPPIFEIEEYESCKAEGKLYCRVFLILSPKNTKNVSEHWRLIQDTIVDKRYYNHNELFHAICANNVCPSINKDDVSDEDIKEKLTNCYKNKYDNLGLDVNLTYIDCKNHDYVYTATWIDYIALFLFITYLSIVGLATICDSKIRNPKYFENTYIKTIFAGRFVSTFSLISNWERICSNSDTQTLKSMQGIRFYNMLLIILCHTFSSFIGGYVSNTDYFEHIEENALRLGLRTLFVFLVQTFFLFSAFLLSYNVFYSMQKYNTFTSWNIVLMFLKRYLRIIPPVLIMVTMGSTMWIVSYFFYGPIKNLYSDVEYQRCQKNWWTTLLFVNNHYNQHNMCYFITWYLAADTQLYVLSLVILYLAWKYRQRTNLILTVCVVIGVLIPSVMCYLYDLDIIYRITPENSKNNKFRSFAFNAIYSSTYANIHTYMVGLYLGYVYFKVQNRNIFQSWISRIIWFLLFFGLPLIVVVTSFNEYPRIYSAILTGILKPLYAVGIAIGVLGMAQQKSGIVKRICEWKPALFMGNFTYSTYVVHYGLVFYRTAAAKEPLYISDTVLVMSFIRDALVSYFCGFLMHIIVEMPAAQIQNMLIPKVHTNCKKVTKCNQKKSSENKKK